MALSARRYTEEETRAIKARLRATQRENAARGQEDARERSLMDRREREVLRTIARLEAKYGERVWFDIWRALDLRRNRVEERG
jgi:hypothetical protein